MIIWVQSSCTSHPKHFNQKTADRSLLCDDLVTRRLFLFHVHGTFRRSLLIALPIMVDADQGEIKQSPWKKIVEVLSGDIDPSTTIIVAFWAVLFFRKLEGLEGATVTLNLMTLSRIEYGG